MTQTTAAESAFLPDLALAQRGRAEMEFQQAGRAGLRPLRRLVTERIEASGALAVGSSDISALRDAVDAVIVHEPAHAVVGAALRWSRRAITPRGVEAFEAQRDELEPLARPPAPDDIEDRVGLDVPRYWDYEFHGTVGGWDGHEHMGFVHHEMIYRFILQAFYPGDIFGQRERVAATAPRGTYRAICDLGCGTGQYTLKLAAAYPDAALTGVDLSMSELRYAQARAAAQGVTLRLVRAPAEQTRLEAEAFDLVTSFILLHEIPPHAIKAVFTEAHRLLEPGGDLVFSDVAPYLRRSPEQAWLDDWDAEIANEPWWRTAAELDLAEVCRSAGFVEVQQVALGEDSYPWVTMARKPAT